MVLPAGVNKATGLMAALEELKISPHNVVGVGDAENDHSFLKLCERSAAVGDALPAVRDTADLCLRGEAGAGVEELAAELIATDLEATRSPDSQRLTFGVDQRGMPVTLEPYGGCILVCGASASGKSTVARRVVESLPSGRLSVLPHRSRRRLRGTTGRRRHRQARCRAAPRRGRSIARGLRRERRRLHDRRPDLRPAALLRGVAVGSLAATRALRETALDRHRRGTPSATGRVGNSERPAAGAPRERVARDGASRAVVGRDAEARHQAHRRRARRRPSCCGNSPRAGACG